MSTENKNQLFFYDSYDSEDDADVIPKAFQVHDVKFTEEQLKEPPITGEDYLSRVRFFICFRQK